MLEPIPETTPLRVEQLAFARRSFIDSKALSILRVSERPTFLQDKITQEEYVTALTGANIMVQRLLIQARVRSDICSPFREIGDLFHLTAIPDFAKQEVMGRLASASTRKDSSGYWVPNVRLDNAMSAIAAEEPDLVRLLALNGTISPEYYQNALATHQTAHFIMEILNQYSMPY